MTPTFANYLDRRIYKAIQGYTEGHPQSLVGILAYVDSQERLVLSHEELAGGLKRLIDAGLIAEGRKHTFFPALGNAPAKSFSGLSLAEHYQATWEYRREFEAADLDDDDPSAAFTRQKLVIRWKLPEGTWPADDDEDAAEAFCDIIEESLANSGLGEINGFEHSSGQIDILIFGRETDADVDAVYSLVVDAFKTYGCPSGSCLIKCFAEPRREVVCDRVP